MSSMETRCIRDRFTIVRQLGSGGMGVVYEAIDQNNGRHVALKTMRAPSGDALLRFKQEFRALQDIHHPNLITLGDLIAEAGQWWFSMELVRGVNFLAYVRPVPKLGPQDSQVALGETAPQPMTPPMPAKVSAPTERLLATVDTAPPSFDETRLRAAFLQLIEGLHALHLAHKVHRDIKPDNALVAEGGRVIILDFGLVGESLQSESAVIGTVAYMAPEQAAGRPVGPAADWYSVGVLLYEALTGRLPFEGTTLEILADKQSRLPPAPSSLVPQLPLDLDELCMDLLHTQPSERPDFIEIRRRLLPAASPQQEVDHSGAFFVGRRQEMETLSLAFAETLKGQARTVLLHGESGVGKSAAMRRFADQVSEQTSGLVVLAGRCYEHESVPFKAIDGLIDQLARTLKRWPQSTVEALLPRRAAVLLQAFPVLGLVPVLAKMPAGPGTLAADPQEQRSRVFTALRELLGRMAERQPLLLLIDDLQWTDADSLALLASVMNPPDEPSLLLVGTVRTGTTVLRGTWVDPERPSDRVQHLHLHQLSKEEALHLAQQMAGPHGISEAGRLQRLVEETGGHPLFIQELVRHTTSHKADDPPRLDDALWARIGDLPKPAQELLRLCAVMGSPLPVNIAIQATALQLDEIDRSLVQLRAAYLLRASLHDYNSDSGAQEIRAVEPYHDRIRELIVERLPTEYRRNCHQRLAEALEALGANDPEALSYHYEGAGELAAAGRYALQAADKAIQALAFERAARFYQQALEWLKPTGDGKRELLIKRAEACINAGRGSEAAALFIEATEGADPQRSSALRLRAGDQYLRSGYFNQGLDLVKRAFEELGLIYYTTIVGLIVSILLYGIWLRLRGLRFRERSKANLPDIEQARLQALRVCVDGFLTIDPFRTMEFYQRYLSRALKFGLVDDIRFGLSFQAIHRSSSGNEADWRRGQYLLERMRSLRKARDHSYITAHEFVTEATINMGSGQFRYAANRFKQASDIFAEQCQGVTFELGMTRHMELVAAYYLGELGQIIARTHALLCDARARQDLHLEVALCTTPLQIIGIMQDDSSRTTNEAINCIRKWTCSGAAIYKIMFAIWQANVLLYEGKSNEFPMDIIRGGLAKQLVQNLQILRILCSDILGRSTLLTCIKTEQTSLKQKLQQLTRHIRALDREKRPWADALSHNLTAAKAHLGGDLGPRPASP